MATDTPPIALSIGAPIGLVEIPDGKRGLIRIRGKPLVLTDSGYYVWLHGLASPTMTFLEGKADEILTESSRQRLGDLMDHGLIIRVTPDDEFGGMDLEQLVAYPLGMGLGHAAGNAGDYLIGDTAGTPLIQVDGFAYGIWSDLVPLEPLAACAMRISNQFDVTTKAASARVAALVVALMKARLITLDYASSGAAHSGESSGGTAVRVRTRRIGG